jgi:uncharacterized protein
MGSRGRPRCLRTVEGVPDVDYFKPRGIPLTGLRVNSLKVEELEALRLVDLEGLEQEDAAERMGVSRRTLARELVSARRKVSQALIEGKAIEIKGGHYVSDGEIVFRCLQGNHEWKARKPGECPECGSADIIRSRS